MPSHSETRFSPHTPAQLYAMVLDVEKYPEFLPWCKAARVMDKHGDTFVGELVISFNHLTESYKSKVVGTRPGTTHHPLPTAHSIEVSLISGPFKSLTNHWRFEPAEGGSTIHFAVEFEFRSKILEKLIGGVFARAVEKMGNAFAQRADQLYA